MKALFNDLKSRISTNIPAIKTVRMFNNQFVHSNGTDNKLGGQKIGYRDEKAFQYPACFVEFIIEETDARCMGIIDYILTVRFRFGIRSQKFERLDTFDFCDVFRSFMQQGIPASFYGLCSSFQEIQTEFDEDFDNVETPYIDYRVRYRSLAAYIRKNDVITTPTIITINLT